MDLDLDLDRSGGFNSVLVSSVPSLLANLDRKNLALLCGIDFDSISVWSLVPRILNSDCRFIKSRSGQIWQKNLEGQTEILALYR